MRAHEGEHIRIKNIVGKDDDLNGRTGVLTHKFGFFPSGDFGVYLDDGDRTSIDICNVFNDEVEKI